jgi:hypothetical protein
MDINKKSISRRDFLRTGGVSMAGLVGLAGLAAGILIMYVTALLVKF